MKAPNLLYKHSLQLVILALLELMGLGLHWGFPLLHYPLINYCSTLKRNKSKSCSIKITNIMIPEFESKACYANQNSLDSCLEFSLVPPSRAVRHIWIHGLKEMKMTVANSVTGVSDRSVHRV